MCKTRSSLGITPQPSVGLCGETHLDKGSQKHYQLWQSPLVITIPDYKALEPETCQQPCAQRKGGWVTNSMIPIINMRMQVRFQPSPMASSVTGEGEPPALYMMNNSLAKGPGKCRCFNKIVVALDCGKRTAAKRLQVSGVGKGLGESIVEPPWKQTKKSGVTACRKVSRRYTRVINPCFPLQGIASLH